MSKPGRNGLLEFIAAIASIAALVFAFTTVQSRNRLLESERQAEDRHRALTIQLEDEREAASALREQNRTGISLLSGQVSDLEGQLKEANIAAALGEQAAAESASEINRLDDEIQTLARQVEVKTQENATAKARIAELEANHVALAQKRIAEMIEDDPFWETMAADPNIQSIYAPFTSKGTFDLGSLRVISKSMPISYRALQENRVLTSYGVFEDAMIGGGGAGSRWRKNNRGPKLNKPVSDEEKAEMEELFQNFKNLGPIWARTGVLAP